MTETARDPLATALREIMLPGAWKELTDRPGAWVTVLTTEHLARLRAVLAASTAEPPTARDAQVRAWPSRADFRKMSPSEINQFLASRGLRVRVRDDEPSTASDARVAFPDAVRTALGLMHSAILSGESWSVELAEAYENAVSALRPPTSETPPDAKAEAMRGWAVPPNLHPATPWLSLSVALAILNGTHPALASAESATSETPPARDARLRDARDAMVTEIREATQILSDAYQANPAEAKRWRAAVDRIHLAVAAFAIAADAPHATSETPDPLPLDVGLLSEALARTFKVMLEGRPNVTAGPPDETVDRAWANVLAAEYAHLAAARGSE